MKKSVLTVAVLAAVCFLFAGNAKADNLHLCDTNIVCNAGSVIPITTTTVFANGSFSAGDTLYIAVLTPVLDNSGTFNSGTNLWAALGENPNQVFPNLASAISQEGGATGIVAGSFNVSDFSVGSWTGSTQITLPSSSFGTMFVAFTEDANGGLSLVSPWSSSLVNVPEPSSLTLLGAGLLGLLALTGKKLIAV
ncbi:MAG: hypothetical protein PVS2B2_14030 [Candidatus Acidiferrum sp.]